MQVKIPCSHCGKALKVSTEHLGRKARCPYCQAAIVLEGSADGAAATASSPTVGVDASQESRQAIVQALQEHTASLHEWKNHIETLGSVVAQHITEGWDKVQQSIEQSQQRQAEQYRALLAEGRQEKQSLEQASAARKDESQQAIVAALKQQSDSLRASAEGMNGIGSAVAQQILAGWERIQQRLDESHREQIQEMRALLAESSQEKQQVVEQAKAIQEAQSKQAAATAEALAEIAGGLREEVQQVREAHAKQAVTTTAALAEIAGKVRDEVLQLHEAQACSTSGEDSAQSQEVREALISSLRQHAASLREWSGEIGTLGSVLAKQMGEGWDQVQQRLDQSHQKQVKEIRELLAEAGQEKKDLLEQSRAIQEAQLHQAAAAAASLAETAVKVHEQVLRLHEKQAEGTKEIVAALSAELKTAQRDVLVQNQKQLEAGSRVIADLVGQAANALAQFSQQSQALPTQLKGALEGIGVELRKQLEATAGHAQGLLSSQATALTELGKSVSQSVGQVDKLPERLTSALEACGTQLGEQVKAAARESQEILRAPAAALGQLSASLEASAQGMAKLPGQFAGEMQSFGEALGQQVEASAKAAQENLRVEASALGDVAGSLRQSAREIASLPVQIGESLNACAAELRRQAQQSAREGEQAFRGQVAALGEMAQAFQNGIQQTLALPQQLRAALDAYRSELHQRSQEAGSEAAESFKDQLKLVGEMGETIRQSAREFAGQLEQIRSAYVTELADAMQHTKQVAIELQKELAAGTQQSTSQMDELQVAWTVHAQATTRQLAALHQAFESAAARAMEKVERARSAADEAGTQRLQRLSSEAEALLTEVYRRSEQVMRQSWEMGMRAAGQHEAKLAAISDQIVTSLARSHETLAQPLTTLNELLQKTSALAPIEQALSRSMEALSAGDSFKKTLGTIDQSLGRLNRLLHVLSEQMGIPAEVGAEDKEGMSGWIRRHLAKGS
jgi:hypothetical protein